MICFRCSKSNCDCSDGITLYHGDAFDMADAFEHDFDLTITDPPYGMRWRNKQAIVKRKLIANDDAFPVDFVKKLISKSSRGVYSFCRWENLPELPKPKSFLCWVKNSHSMGDLQHEHGRIWEAIAFWPGTCHEFKKRTPDVRNFDRTGNTFHPTEKPVGLIESIIEPNVCDSIFDPFAGSGSTLIAAKQCGKRAIGIEIEEEYCETIARRLDQKLLF